MSEYANVVRVRELRDIRLHELLRDSRGEGFDFLVRLESDWRSGRNRFGLPGEALFAVAVAVGGATVGLCGLNVDPYQSDPRVGRLRHLYVLAGHRRRGWGSRLVRHAVGHARAAAFREIRLRTDTRPAARFYEGLGFRRRSGVPHSTHVLPLGTGDGSAGPNR